MGELPHSMGEYPGYSLGEFGGKSFMLPHSIPYQICIMMDESIFERGEQSACDLTNVHEKYEAPPVTFLLQKINSSRTDVSGNGF